MRKLNLTLLYAAGFALLAYPSQAAETVFAPRAEGFDFVHNYSGGWEHFVGGGMATFDCNGDHFPDALLAGGSDPSRLIVNTTGEAGAAIQFKSAPDSGAEFEHVTGAYPLDIDSDGITDLFVMRVGENKLLRGLPNCKFEEANDDWHFDGGDKWTTSFSATWEEGKDFPTLAAGNYVDRSNPDGPFRACDINQLYRPEGKAYSAAIDLEPGYCALSMLFSDWMRTGRRDLRISNDRHYYVDHGEEQMWRLDEMRSLTREDGWQPISVWGMGIASQDLNNDEKPDVVLTSMGDQLMQFYAGGARMENAPFSIGAYAHKPYTGDDGRPSTGWHAEFGDVDNDGLPDLFIAKGNVDQMPGMATKDPNNLLKQKPDGTFYEIGLEAGIANMARSRGAAVVDFNRDGKLDIAVMNRRAPFEVYENISETVGNFVSLNISQEGINHDAIGAWVELRGASTGKIQIHEINVGGGHASGEIAPVHFGLGTAQKAELRIIWPDGAASDWSTVPANQQLSVERVKATNAFTVHETRD